MDSPRTAGTVLKQLLAVSANCASIAARLRLTPQQQIDRHSGRITEAGLGDAADNRLLGGRDPRFGHGSADDRLLGGSEAWGSAPTRKP